MRGSLEGTHSFLMPSTAWAEPAEPALEAARTCGCTELSRTLMAKVRFQVVEEVSSGPDGLKA